MKTTGRSAAGMCDARLNRWSRSAGRRRLRISISLLIAPVAPEPQKITTSSDEPPTERWMIRRASSRKRVVCRPVVEVSVWVLAYSGSTSSRMKSSMKPSERPEAV